MAMAARKVVELCSLNADVLREDLALMEQRTVTVHAGGADVTREYVARLRANLSRLQEIIDLQRRTFERDASARAPVPARLKARSFASNETTGVSFIEWVIHFVTDEGRPMRLDEVAVQKWARGHISEERFYYECVIDECDTVEAS